MKRWVVLSVAALSAAGGMAACAYGADGSGDGTTGYLPDASAGDGGSQHGRDSGGVVPGTDSGSTLPDGAAPPGDDSGTGGGDGGGSGTDGGGPGGIPCTAADTCGGAATSLGSVSGDTSGSPVSSSGQTSEWLVLDVTENDSGIFGVPMNLAVTLTSPAGENFDLYLYLGNNPTAIECTKVGASSANGAGQIDTASLSWGEMGFFSNGSSDSAHVIVEVRSAPGNNCDAASSWQLTAQGG
jgi:hypothetical protein